MAEVIPGSLRRDETSGDNESGMVIDGEQEDLLVKCGPPLMDGTVVQEKLTDAGAAKAPVGLLFAKWDGDKMWKVGFDMGLDA